MFKALLLTLLLSMTNQTCKDSSPFCLSCLQDQCVKCIYSYIQNKTCVLPTVVIKNCMFYASNNKCSFCEPQFMLKDNQCVPIDIINCKHSEKQGECLICQDNLKLSKDNKQCTETCKLQNCKNCAKDIFDNEFCGVCENGFALDQFFRCHTEPVAHCDKMLNKECIRCKIGNRHDGNNCHKVDYVKILEEKQKELEKQNKEKQKEEEMVLLKSSNPNTQPKTEQKVDKKPEEIKQKPQTNNTQSHNHNKQDNHSVNSHNHNHHHNPLQHNPFTKHSLNHHGHTRSEQNDKHKNNIIVKADKLLNESKVNLDNKKSTNRVQNNNINIPTIFISIIITYLVNQYQKNIFAFINQIKILFIQISIISIDSYSYIFTLILH